MTFSFVGCGNKKPTQNINGEVEEATIDTPDNSKNEQAIDQLPTYDYKNLPKSNALSKEDYNSFYAEQLTTNMKITYDEIYNAAKEFLAETVLSKPVSPENLQKIMNIIYLDTPELFMLETDYSYDTDANGNVSKIYLKYIIEPEYREQIMKQAVSDSSRIVSSLRNEDNELEVEMKLLKQMEQSRYSSKNIQEGFTSEHYKDSFYAMLRGTGSDIARAKYFSYFCRKAGINATIMVGELTSTNLFVGTTYEKPAFKNVEDIIVKMVDGSHVDVSCDYSGLYAWNIIQLNEKWYNVDTMLTSVLKEKDPYFADVDSESIRLLVNVDDYIISQSRIFYMNEDLLGLTPQCNDKNFQFKYREGKFILNYNTSQMPIIISKKLDELISKKSKSVIYQFGTEESFDLFVSIFDKSVEIYNKNNGNAIQNYAIEPHRDFLTVVIKDLIFYQ